MPEMSNLIESIKLKGREFRGRLVSLVFWLSGSLFFVNQSIHEYFSHGFSRFFVTEVLWMSLSIINIVGIVLHKSLTTSSGLENESNSISTKEVLFRTAKLILFTIPIIFVFHIFLHNSFYFLVHIMNEKSYIVYRNYSKELREVSGLFLATGCLISSIHRLFVKLEDQILRKTTEFVYMSLFTIAGLLGLSI
jgi:hypothetical protein